MAFETPKITAACVEATEFMELSRRYRVSSVPKTVVNGKTEILGAVPEDVFVKAVLTPDA
jgi:predicted DsbA family dithiol-disulfide isomerase